jgi:hypothetical protein
VICIPSHRFLSRFIFANYELLIVPSNLRSQSNPIHPTLPYHKPNPIHATYSFLFLLYLVLGPGTTTILPFVLFLILFMHAVLMIQ